MILFRSLSARLLVLTIGFVMLAEILIFAPSVARFRLDWLERRLSEAALAALTLEAAPRGMVTPALEAKLLHQVNALVIDRVQPNGRVYLLSDPLPPVPDADIDLHQTSPLGLIGDAFAALVRRDSRVIRVTGPVPQDASATVIVVMDEAPMSAALVAYGGRILALSILISLITAGLVFFSLNWLLVQPMMRITASLISFRRDPEAEGAVITPSTRRDEIGSAERELADMQATVRGALRQKTRLAALGTAVAKINHDLGNILATASLVSERLAASADPDVRLVTPRLMTALDRAAALCRQTLSYARDGVLPLTRTTFALADLIREVAADLELQNAGGQLAGGKLTWDCALPADLTVWADRDQLARVVTNLARNAWQAGADRLTLTLGSDARPELLRLHFADNGPGLAPRAHEHLFQPFAGSGRPGGTGLGLVIAQEILRAHGGALRLTHTSADGTVFTLELPGG